MEHVYFEVQGEPVAKARARTVRKGGRTWSFTPKRVAAWEKTVKEEAAKHFEKPLVGPVMVSLIFHMGRPASRRVDVWVPTTPDLDNLEKAVLDGLNGVAYLDDRFVVSKNSQKRYVREDEPRVCVRVTSLSRQAGLGGFGVEAPVRKPRVKEAGVKSKRGRRAAGPEPMATLLKAECDKVLEASLSV